MKSKYIGALVVLVLIAVAFTACSSAPAAPTGETTLVVTGNLGVTNAGDNFEFDAEMFSNNLTELVINDPWMGDGLNYSGMTLASILEVVEAPESATSVIVVAQDGFELVIPIEDALKWDILLVHFIDGEPLTEDNGGPVKIAFPDEARETYLDDNWVWWVVEVIIE